MAKVVQRRRGNTSEHEAFTGAPAETTIDITKNTVVVHDGNTVGGFPLAREDLTNVSTTLLTAITGVNTNSVDTFFIYDTSAGLIKSITRAELNNAITSSDLNNISVISGTIDNTIIGDTTAAAGTFTDLIVNGNLTVNGTTTTINTSELTVEDTNITIAAGAANPAAADGGGITVDGAGAAITYASTGDKWVINKPLDLGANNLSTSGSVSLTGGVANSVLYLNNSKTVTSITSFVFDGSNLGIGVTNPASTLDVAGDITIADKIIHSGDTDTTIRFPTLNTVTIETAAAERVRVTSTGDVGIGTPSPLTEFHVEGSVYISDTNPFLYINDSDGKRYDLYSTANDFIIRDGTDDIKRIVLKSDGKVGIGTSDPTEKLDVVGNANVSGTVTATTFVGALTGNAVTATTLETARLIGGVSFNGSANINLPGVNTTGNQNTTGSAATLTTGRTIGMTGDVSWTSTAFDGSSNVTGTATLSNSGVTAGSYGSATTIPVLTIDAKGRVTAASTSTVSDGTLTLSTSGIATGSQTFTANQATAATFTVNVPATNIAEGTRTTTTVPITSSTGTNATLSAASTTLAGVMSSADKTKLNNIEAGAQVNVATNLGITAGTTAGPIVTSSTGTNATLPTASGTASGVVTTGNQTWAGVKTFSSTITGSITGNAATATTLQTARLIGGVSFNGSANINLPGVNTTGNQNTTGSAATLTTARTINGTSFNGSANIITANWGTVRTLWGNSVNGSGDITAPLLPAAGTAALPAFSTSGDTNTGVFFPAADTLAISSASVERLRVDANGNIGVGTAFTFGDVNQRHLTVSGNSTAVVTLLTGTVAAGFAAASAGFTVGAAFGTFTNHPVGINVNNIVRISIDIAGNVGIGVAAPTSKLDVDGDITIADKIIHSGDTNTSIRFPAADTVSIETNGAERLRVDANGNVSISASTPKAKLQIEEVGIETTTTSVTDTTQTSVYEYSATDFRTAELMCQIVDSTNSHYHSAKFMIIHNSTDVWFNQSSVIHSHDELGTFTVNISSGNVRLLFTPVAATTKSVKVAATMLTP